MDLSIVVVNYNGKPLLERLLPSLQTQVLEKTRFDVEIVVVDNASTDGSREYLASVKYIRRLQSEANGGFAYGNNLALKDLTSSYVLLLNSDTEIPSQTSTIDLLLEYMEEHPNVGIVSPLVLLSDGSMDTACHRGEPTLWASFCYLTGLERIAGKSRLFGKYHLTHLPPDNIHPIEACTGAAMLVRVSAMEQIGLLDERFFMYAEDLDWCKRFRALGFEIVFHPQVAVTHHKYQSGINSEEHCLQKNSRKHFYSSMLLFYDKHYANRYPGWIRWFIQYFVSRNS
jgi:GT2 family glycosyltransferase